MLCRCLQASVGYTWCRGSVGESHKNTQNLVSREKAEACGKEDKVMSPSPGFVEKAEN